MEPREFRCQFCNYIPRTHEQPTSDSWYCPKCGKKTILSQTRESPRRFPTKRLQPRKPSRDRISTRIYTELTEQTDRDFGLKDPYLNPKIHTIKPRLRKGIRIFSRQQRKLTK